jgi:helicase required for RNAi-mediated heterochromatin assembly 1
MASARELAIATKIIQEHVLKPYGRELHIEPWRNLPEIPDKSEIMPKENERDRYKVEEWNDYQKDPVYDVNLPVNIIDKPWPSKEEYISAHYQILREDAIASLRNSVKSFKRNPEMDDDNFTHVYTSVSITNTLSRSSSAYHYGGSLQRILA